jgi:hypothetical protein
MEERKRRDFYFYFFKMSMEVPIWMCSPLVRNALGYRPHATLPQENPLIWGPPLQLYSSIVEILENSIWNLLK